MTIGKHIPYYEILSVKFIFFKYKYIMQFIFMTTEYNKENNNTIQAQFISLGRNKNKDTYIVYTLINNITRKVIQRLQVNLNKLLYNT